jgi:hypothetical protein
MILCDGDGIGWCAGLCAIFPNSFAAAGLAARAVCGAGLAIAAARRGVMLNICMMSWSPEQRRANRAQLVGLDIGIDRQRHRRVMAVPARNDVRRAWRPWDRIPSNRTRLAAPHRSLMRCLSTQQRPQRAGTRCGLLLTQHSAAAVIALAVAALASICDPERHLTPPLAYTHGGYATREFGRVLLLSTRRVALPQFLPPISSPRPSASTNKPAVQRVPAGIQTCSAGGWGQVVAGSNPVSPTRV